MVQTAFSAALLGLEAIPVRVEVAIRRGTPMIGIVGLAPSAARECRERFRSAAAQLGLHVPGLRITVNHRPDNSGRLQYRLMPVEEVEAANPSFPFTDVGSSGTESMIRSP